jgi:hypothetical protein
MIKIWEGVSTRTYHDIYCALTKENVVMKLSTIFDALTYGELKQLSIGGVEDEGIFPQYSKEVLIHINLALVNLYNKFPLEEKEINLKIQADKVKYLLTSEFTTTNNVDGYIEDTYAEPFTEDILRVNAVCNSEGVELPINDPHSFSSIFLPAYNVIKFPYAIVDEVYTLVYRVKPATVVIPDGSTPADVEVPLPDVLLEPLLTYVSSRAQNARGGDTGVQEGMVAMQQYEQMCKELEVNNTFNSSLNTGNLKLDINGWA